MTEVLPELTYDQLGRVLLALGFKEYTSETGGRVYKHKETGALLAFPVLADQPTVLPRHFIATQMVLDAYGILGPREFDARVRQSAA